MASKQDRRRLLFALAAATLVLSQLVARPALCIGTTSSAAANGVPVGQSASESVSSSQPLWSYQVRPSAFVGASSSPSPSHYGPSSFGGASPMSLFDAFSGLSQRQGALSSSPFLSLLPIILIAAGGMLLLLPLLTMMMASPFGGAGVFGGGGGFPNYGGGYPQVGAALSKKRSLEPQINVGGQQRSFIDLIEHVSSTIESLTRTYAPPGNAAQQNKRAKSLHLDGNAPQASNHKAADNVAAEQNSSQSAGPANNLNGV